MEPKVEAEREKAEGERGIETEKHTCAKFG